MPTAFRAASWLLLRLCQHAGHPHAIKPYKLHIILGVRTQVTHDQLISFQLCELVNTPPPHFHLIGDAYLHHGLQGR